MRRFLTLAGFALALSVSACGPLPVTKVVTIGLEPSTVEQRTAAASILAARFDGYRASRTSSFVTKVLEKSVVIEFRGDAPEDVVLQSTCAVQGIFRVSPADAKHRLLMSDLDIENATVFKLDDGGSLEIQLTERAGAKMEEFTRRNVGRVLITTLDRKEISRTTVSGVFGRRFQTSGLDLELARELALILRHGRLPVAVTNVDIKNSTD